MWITAVSLLAALYVPTTLANESRLKCCYEYYSDGITRDRYNRITNIKKTLTYADLDSGEPLTEEVEQHTKKSCGDSDIIGTLIDEKLGGSGNETSNAIPMNNATLEIWRDNVTEPIYYFLTENIDKTVMFEVRLYYDDRDSTRPFFVAVRIRRVFCANYEYHCQWKHLSDEYLFKGFIPNPTEAETVVPYLYSGEKMITFHLEPVILEQEIIAFDQYNASMQRKYGPLVEGRDPCNFSIPELGLRNVTRVEWAQKSIRGFKQLDADYGRWNSYSADERRLYKTKQWARMMGNDNDVPGSLISARLGGADLGDYDYAPMDPRAFEELEDYVKFHIIDHYKGAPWNWRNWVTLDVFALYEDNLTLRPAGFFVSADITLFQDHIRSVYVNMILKSLPHPELPTCFIKN